MTPRANFLIIGRIVGTVSLTFLCYFAIGLQLAILPGFVHTTLGLGSLMAGLAISAQYLATFLSRPHAGRMADQVGPKQTVLLGLAGCSMSGVLLFASALTCRAPILSLVILLASRLVLGFAESWVGTGSPSWVIARLGPHHTTRIISWNGVATYGGLAFGAPVGVALAHGFGFGAIGLAVIGLGGIGAVVAAFRPAVAVVAADDRLAMHQLFKRVLPYGVALALGSVGFGSIASFIALYFAERHWDGAAFALTLFGLSFVGGRLVFARAIDRFGGFRVAIATMMLEGAGLLLLWAAPTHDLALGAAALTGLGFAMVFPALGGEAVGAAPPQNRGGALGLFSAFLDAALALSGPIAGLIASGFGFAAIFAFAAVAAFGGSVVTALLLNATRRTSSLSVETSPGV